MTKLNHCVCQSVLPCLSYTAVSSHKSFDAGVWLWLVAYLRLWLNLQIIRHWSYAGLYIMEIQVRFFFFFFSWRDVMCIQTVYFTTVVLKPVLEYPQPCTFCMSPSSITPDSTHQLISGDCKTEVGVSDKGRHTKCAVLGVLHGEVWKPLLYNNNLVVVKGVIGCPFSTSWYEYLGS